MAANNSVNISFTVNGERFNNVDVPSRQHLADYLRSQGFTGTHLGCEQGACGACTIEMDGKAVRSCLVLASQANGTNLKTVEGFELSVLKGAMSVITRDLPVIAFEQHISNLLIASELSG